MKTTSKALATVAAVLTLLTCLFGLNVAGLRNGSGEDHSGHIHDAQLEAVEGRAHTRSLPAQNHQIVRSAELREAQADGTAGIRDRGHPVQDNPAIDSTASIKIKSELQSAGSIQRWSQQYGQGASSLEEGVTIAKAQAPLMRQLMRIDPDSAHEVAMPEAAWRNLPREVQPHVARRFSAIGQFEVLVDNISKEEKRQVTMAGFSSNDASVSPELSNHRFYEGEIAGVTLSNDIAVVEMGEETPQPLAAADPEVVNATGNYAVLWLNVKYSDELNYPATVTQAESSLASSAANFATWSYGRLNMTYEADQVSIPSTKGVSSATVRTEAKAAATALGYTISNYDVVIYRTTNEGNYAWVWGSDVHLKTNSVGTTMHEIGHCMGLHHANWWRTDAGQPPWGSGTNVLYGEGWSTMGGSGDFNAYEKKALGWLDKGTDYAENISQGTYRIYPYDSHKGNFNKTGVTGAYYGASIFKDTRATHGEAADRRYSLSWRNQPEKGSNYNRWYQEGLLLYFEPWTRNGSSGYNVNGPFGSTIVDAHPGSKNLIGSKEQDDAAIYIGETYVDNDPGNRDGDIYITPLTKTDPDGVPRSGDEYIDVKVVIGNQSGNKAPSGSLAADKLVVMRNETVNLQVSASDPDDTVLAYYWDFGLAPTKNNRALMKLNGLPSQTFSWPADGIYTVKVVVSDCRGGTVELTQDIVVGNVHTVTFDLGTNGTRSGGGELVQYVNNGAAAVAPTVNPKSGYVFYQWDKDFSNVTADMTVYAQYRSSSNLAPEVDAGDDQTVALQAGSALAGLHSDHLRMNNDGSGAVEGAYYEWEASHELDGNNIWASTTQNSYNWTFASNLIPEDVADGRFDRLTHAFAFPAAKVASSGHFSNVGSTEPATFELVIQIDGNNGSIFETGGSGDGLQIDVINGVLRGTVQESTPARAVYELTANELGRFIHVVFVADNVANEVKLYVDGDLKDTQPWTAGEKWSGTDNAGLGAATSSTPTGGSTTDFDGKMALFRYYRNKAFTTEEVHTNLDSLSTGFVAVATLDGTVVDPEGDTFTSAWSLVEGPGAVFFEDPSAVDTAATFYTTGTYILRLTANDGLAEASDDVVITVTNGVDGFAAWIAGYNLGGLTGMYDDPDGDKHSNLMEFAFGTDPTLNDAGPLVTDGTRHGDPVAEKLDGGGMVFCYIRLKNHSSSGISYTVCFSSNLSTFYDNDDVANPPVEIITSSVNAAYEVVKVPFPSILENGKAAKFGRVRIDSTSAP